MELFTARNVYKTFATTRALTNVSISVKEQSIFGLLGPNGAGKTTLIRIINQITAPDEGEVLLNGRRMKQTDVSVIGYLPEERGLYKKMKVGEQAIYLARLKGMSRHDAIESLKLWFDRFEMKGWWNKKVEELSKGMQQKVQFVTTVVHNPKLLIFDEPFSGFDPINANLLKDEILKLRDDGATIIFSTHRMESVEEMCDHIALINKSNKILDGRLVDIKREFKNNTFEIGLITPDHNNTTSLLKEKFEMFPANFKSINDELQYQIKIPDGHSPNELIGYLTSLGQLTHFVEVIPSASEIFIQTIQKN